MAGSTPDYGLDAELKAKRDAKYDPELERKVTAWIESISGKPKGAQSFAAWLKDGKVLCALVNGISPGTVKSVDESTLAYKQMDNITRFMNAAREFGVPESAMFSTPDLYEEKNLGSVVNCINTLGGVVQVRFPHFSGPKLGVPMTVPSHDVKRASVQARQSGGFEGVMEVERPKERADYVVRNTGDAAWEKRASGGASRLRHPAEKAQGPSSRTPSPFPRTTAAVVASGVSEGTQNEDLTYGMDKELKAKMEGKHDAGLEKQVVHWIEAVSGERKGDQTMAEWLKNGQVLCRLANSIRPGIVKSVHTSPLPFMQMENITFFMDAARELGVPEAAMFGTPDLYEEKNMPSVVNCIYTLGGAVQVSCPGLRKPKLGVAMHAESKDKKRGSGICTDAFSGFSTSMEVARPRERADYVVKPIDRS